MNEKEIYNPGHFKEIIDKLKEQEKLFKNIEDKEIVRRISKHDVLVRGELNDLDVIWNRFLYNRNELLKVDYLSHKYTDKDDFKSEEAKKLFAKELKLTASLKVDLKSLFLFGDILFNKFVLLGRSVYGQSRGVKVESFSSFIKSIRNLKDNSLPEYSLYKEIGEDLEKIDVLLGFYRDKFIVHVSGSYQEGITRGVYVPEFQLDHTSWKLDQFDFTEFKKLTDQLKSILPEQDRYGNPLDQPCDPRLKIDALFRNLHKIKDDKLREKAEGYIRSVGLTSPDIYYLIKTLKDTSIKFIEFLMEQINSFRKKS